MTVTISSYVEGTHKELEFLELLRKAYPDAKRETLGNFLGQRRHVWMSASLQVEDCDDFEVLSLKYCSDSPPPSPCLCFFKHLGEGRVYPGHFSDGVVPMILVTQKLREQEPELFQRLIEAMKNA
jgi:hypothetical protein